MRDARTKGETPLHRAAAFGTEEAIELLLDAGARREAKDVNGDSPLSWASWHLRPDSILRRLCYDGFAIHPARQSTFDHGLKILDEEALGDAVFVCAAVKRNRGGR